jgi:hypothetical protein
MGMGKQNISSAREVTEPGSSVSVLGLDSQSIGVRFFVGLEILSSRPCPDRMWGPASVFGSVVRIKPVSV